MLDKSSSAKDASEAEENGPVDHIHDGEREGEENPGESIDEDGSISAILNHHLPLTARNPTVREVVVRLQLLHLV